MDNIRFDQLVTVSLQVLQVAALLLIFTIGLGLLYLVYRYLADTTRQPNTIRRNYRLIGRFRTLFEHLGVFFRQYFFAMDREEMPFNRVQRSWVYQASNNTDSTVPFGSTRLLNQSNEVIFLNCPFPTLDADSGRSQPVTVRSEYRIATDGRALQS